VYNLKDPADIVASILPIRPGGRRCRLGRATAKNDKGVTLELVAESKGVKFDLSAGSFTIALK